MSVAFLTSLLGTLGSCGDLNEKCLPQCWAFELLLLRWCTVGRFRWCSLVGGSISLGHLKLCAFSFLLFLPPLLLTAMVPHHDSAMVLHQDGAMIPIRMVPWFSNIPYQNGAMLPHHDSATIPHQDGAMVPHHDGLLCLWNHKPK